MLKIVFSLALLILVFLRRFRLITFIVIYVLSFTIFFDWLKEILNHSITLIFFLLLNLNSIISISIMMVVNFIIFIALLEPFLFHFQLPSLMID